MYDVRATASDGGGHVQTANRGGTGRTAYTLGDILVATSSSVLARLAVGLDGQILEADSSVAAGINWVANTTPRISATASVITVSGTTEASLINVTVPGSTLGTNNTVRAVAFISDWRPNAGQSVLAAVQYGGNTVASVFLTPTTTENQSIRGEIRHTIIGNASVNAQRHFLEVKLASYAAPRDTIIFNPIATTTAQGININAFQTNTSSVESSANQTIGMTVRAVTGDPQMTSSGNIVERIT